MRIEPRHIGTAIDAQRGRLAELVATDSACEATGSSSGRISKDELLLVAEQLVTILAEAVRSEDPELLDDFLLQTGRRLAVTGQHPDSLIRQVEVLQRVLEQTNVHHYTSSSSDSLRSEL